MIEVLNIMPLSYMERYFLKDNNQGKCIVMAHLMENKKYLSIIKEIKENGNYILLDNSAPYLGSSVNNEDLLDCIKLIKPDEVILPDVLDDGEETIKRTKEFLDAFSKYNRIKFMAVPQGKTIEEYKECYKIFARNSQIDLIGLSFSVSRLFNVQIDINKYSSPRERLIKLFIDEGIIDYSKPHHLLGFANSGNIELERLSKYHFIKRCDSNAAYKTAREKNLLEFDKPYTKPERPISFYLKFDAKIYKLMKKNISVLVDSGNLREKFPVIIRNVSSHTMGNQLHRYLEIKVHHLIKERNFKRILIKGEYNRDMIISKNEKSNKLFNFHRPTARIEGNNLTLFVPPGKDYVMHYASLIATYLSLKGRRYDHVLYLEPASKKCEGLLLSSHLDKMNVKETIIFGYGLEKMFGLSSWKENGAFLYKNIKIGKNEVTLLGCKHSIWGDIAERVIKILAKEHNIKNLIYIGKLGSLKENIKPNSFLATGNTSFVKGKEVKWKNIFEKVKSSPILIKGKHYSSPSILLENKIWLDKNGHLDFVDPEIGYFAKGAIETNVNFGYLHIISNNLFKMNNENLSNEREQSILDKRKRLLLEIKKILYEVINQQNI